MYQVPSADLVKHIHERISELKSASRVIDAGDVLKSLQERFPEGGLQFKDVGPLIFTAANIHDVGLVVPGNGVEV